MKKTAPLRAAVGACVALFANMGMNSVFTIFLSRFKEAWPDTDEATIALAATLGCTAAFVCSTFLVAPVLKKLSPRVIFLICAALAVIYCVLYATAGSVLTIIIAGIFGGTVLSFGVHAMGVAAVTPYFADYGKRTEAVIGIVLSSAALGAAVFSFVPGLLMSIGIGWRTIYLIIGAVVALCDLAAFLLIPKAESTSSKKKNMSASSFGAEKALNGLTVREALKTPAFWLVFCGILFMTIMYQGLCTYMPYYLEACGMTGGAASSMQGIMQLTGIVFILMGGMLAGKIGIKGLILFAGAPLAVGCMLYAYVFPHNPTIAFAVVCSVLCVTGGVISNLCPAVTPVLFGEKSLNKINPIFSGGAFWGGAALASQVIGRVLTNTGSFSKAFLTASVIGILGMLLLFAALAVNPSKKAYSAKNTVD